MSADLGAITLADGSTLADLSGAVTSISANWAAGTVAELRVDIADKGRKLSDHSLLALGTQLTWGATLWQVGSVDRTFAGWGVAASVGCRSALAKALRLQADKTRTDKSCTPQSWITRRVAELGGTAVVEAGSSKRTIVQKRGQSVLDVLTALASTMETEWVEIDGVLYVGTPWWAYQGGTGLPTWPVSWLGLPETDATALSATVSEDDLTNGASASLTLPYSQAERIRPWHRIELSGAGAPLDGTWLVGDLTLDVASQSPVSIALTRPLQTSPKKGSAKKTSGAGSSSTTTSGSRSGTGLSNPVSRTRKGKTTTSPRSGRPSPSSPVNRGSTSYAGGTRRPYAAGNPGGSNGGTALDVGMRVGTALYACRSGYVIACRDGVRNHGNSSNPYVWPAAANFVLLGIQYQGRPAKLLYWHMSPGLAVRRGQRVSAGQFLGRSGNTGHSTGGHTHFQASWGHGSSGFGGAIIYPPSRVWA